MSLISTPFAFPYLKPASDPFFAFPSPPSSDTGVELKTSAAFDCDLDFDIDAYTHSSDDADTSAGSLPFSLDDPFAFDVDIDFSSLSQRGSVDLAQSPITNPSVSTPTSTALVSPKSSFTVSDVLLNPVLPGSLSLPLDIESTSASNPTDADAAEALSNHHLQRYLHYKALAAQAEAEARALAAAAAQQTEHFEQRGQFDALLAAFSMPQDQAFPAYKPVQLLSTSQQGAQDMLAYQPQPQAFYGVGQPALPALSYQPQQAASMHHAQAQAHFQAHDAAVRMSQSRAYLHPTYMPPSTRSSFDMPQQQLWSRSSGSTSAASPPFPSTPTYAPLAIPAPNMSRASSVPLFSADVAHSVQAPSLPASEGEPEVDDAEEGEHELDSSESDDDVKPSLDGSSLANLHGGGRGYIPGQTPDDPKKRHKCQVCGRGFARAFNLKSHIQTHNAVRSKPHMCPHASCKRGFSRLHDLERHRQGIHSDGPLVDAKRHGVAPAVARAQGRLQKRAESGGLI